MGFPNINQQAGYAWYYKKWGPLTVAGTSTLDSSANERITLPVQSHTLYICGYGEAGETTAVAPTSWQGSLEGSIDNLIWFQLLSFDTGTGNGVPVYVDSLLSVLNYVRLNLGAITLGSCHHINAHWIGVTK